MVGLYIFGGVILVAIGAFVFFKIKNTVSRIRSHSLGKSARQIRSEKIEDERLEELAKADDRGGK